MMTARAFSVAFVLGLAPAGALAQLALDASFESGLSAVGGTYDPVRDEVWVYPSFGATIHRFSRAGLPLGSFARPGASANDVDLDIAPSAFTLGSTAVPAGSLLYIDGESGVAEIYAVDPVSGSSIASLITVFGVSHVVGGGYHHERATFFLVQDRVPGGTAANRVAEINPQTGAVINTFLVTDARPSFTVNFGDLDVGGNSNLFLVSSDELTSLELTPDGAFVAEHTLPASVGGLAGLGSNPGSCEYWAFNTSGRVSRLVPFDVRLCGTPSCDADLNQDGNVDQDDVDYLIGVVAGGPNPTGIDPDVNRDGNVDQGDIDALINLVAGGPCP